MAIPQPAEKPSQQTLRIQPRARKKSIPAWVWALGILAVAIVAYVAWVKTHSGGDNQKLVTATVTRGDLVETISATGSVTAQTGAQVKIGSQITGRIKALHADVGSFVQAGQVIAELDVPDLQDQLRQAEANLQQAETKLAQQQSGYGITTTQSNTAVIQAQAAVFSAQQKLASAIAAERQTSATTPSDIQRAQTGVATAQAALSTAKSNLAQVQAGANLQISTSQEQLQQAQANAANSSAAFTRAQNLFNKGYIAQADLDAARAQAQVNQSQVRSAQQNVQLTQQKVAADLQSAKDQVTQAQQGVASAQAALQSAKAETYSVASRQADIQDAKAAVQQAQANLQSARANTANNTLKQQDIQAAREAVAQAQAQVAFNRDQIAKAYIRSPISGIVLQMAAQQGETLAAGLSAPTLIVVADLKRLQVDAFVDETDIGKVKLGQPAQCVVDAFPDRPFRGRVAKIASGSTIQQGVVTYDVSIAIEDPRHQLKPDMTASVTIQTGRKSDVVLVPSVAVQMGTRGSTVNVLKMNNGQRQIVPVPVVTGGTDGVNTEIVSGVKEGDTIVLAGANQGQGRGFGPSSPFGPAQKGGGGGGGGRRGGG